MVTVPAITSAVDIADWIELCCLKSRVSRISKSNVLDQLRDYNVASYEETCELAWAELTRRQSALREEYAFQIQNGAIIRTCSWKDRPFYSLLLILSFASKFRQTKIKNFGKVSLIFEKTVALALANLIGGKAHRIGHGREKPVPTSFSDLLQFLSKEMAEGIRIPKPLNRDTKDCKADVVAWRPFRDKRSGQLIVFAQCAVGKGWKKKLTELHLPLWERYLEFNTKPLRAFAMPYIEIDEGLWLEYGTQGGMALDRIRLTELLPHSKIPSKLSKEMNRWTKTIYSKIPEDC